MKEHDVPQVGKPTLIVSGSSFGSIMAGKEAAINRGEEAHVLEADLMDVPTFKEEFNARPDGSWVVISELDLALPEVVEAVKEVLSAPKVVVVAGSYPFTQLDRKTFTDLGGHVIDKRG
jgi:predicted GTPase